MARKRDAAGQKIFDFTPQPELEPEQLPEPSRQQTLFDNHAAPQIEAILSPYPVRANGHTDPSPDPVTNNRTKAWDILAAIRTLKRIEADRRPPTDTERKLLAKFCGFGPVALTLFPDPLTGRYKQGWQTLGEELKELLTPEEYESAKRTVFNAFYTSSTVIKSMFAALKRLGVPDSGLALEPGCGPGRFPMLAPKDMRFIGVELDSISGRIAKALHPQHDIRIENFRDSRLPQLDAVIGNVPFADVKLDYNGHRLSLHDFFMAKSLDALKPGGVMALISTHYTMDKQNAWIREYLGSKADFLGAIRLPSTAFKNEGTNVVTDIIFMRAREPRKQAQHVDPDWLNVAPLEIDGTQVLVNQYFLKHPEQVLGTWSLEKTLYGTDSYSVESNGDLAEQLREAVERLPESAILIRANSPQLEKAPAFIPPPPLKHLTEGSLFVGDDSRIFQIQDGQGVPILYGGSHVWAHGAVAGRRLGGLIRLRDLARRVLQSQNEGWPEQARKDARRKLNQEYGYFTHAFGPINKTTFHETKDGTSIRRMPNISRFRDDPDAMLVMALEEYNEETGQATKAAIMSRDVVGKTPSITHVNSAEEGLLVSLNQKGAVDLAFISQLYGKPEPEIVSELADLIYHDPETKTWQTADQYLSGNVRAKLKMAEAAGETRNAEALRAVQPEDVLPGDIDVSLGAPWLPETDIQDFVAQLFGVEPGSVKVGHLKQDALWSLDAGYAAEQSVAAKTEYGTARANGTWLLELAMNMKSPVIYDPDPDDPEKRVVNQEQTLAAKEKQRAIKEKFKQWIFSDSDRCERLVRTYNDLYNNLRPRLFDGSHLDFPGMSQAMTLRQHQKDAVWRIMSGGNTLLAHCVGAGKSAVMAAAAMKLRQTGLRKKSLIAVPNHLLEQFAREFQQWYPNAKILVATKEDFTKERRKFLTAKIASGDWDAIIVTHSSFERIGMSSEYQKQFLNEQIAEYNQLLIDSAVHKNDRAHRNIIKSLEKQKAAREAKLKDLLAEDKKDDGVVFDELGVDQLFIDEFQAFKRLEAPSKMDRVAGIPSGGSERAFDLYMKARYLDQQHPGHGLVGATGTPITNSLVEMYILQRYFDPDGLRSRLIDHLDGWSANFGEVVDTMEISPDGKTLKPRSRFARFVNLPELQMMFRSFADVQTPDMLKLPTPELKGGKPQVIACPMSEDQHRLQQGLVARYERIRNSKVDPREDNALAITTDGRKLALDARMLSAEAAPFGGSKMEAMLDRVAEHWRKTEGKRGTQMIFCDYGVNPTSWGYSVYEEIVNKLTRGDIPRQEIACIGEADSDAKKRALFDKVRSGQVRVLIGSTQKMGTGTNVQKRLGVLHELDAPWRPDEVQQREGRILRQGNDNPEVAIYRYVTEGSFDAYMWQALETKAKFINQVMRGDGVGRKAEDVGGQELDYATVKSIASGNPAVLTLAEADAEIQRLNVLKRSHADEQYLARRNLRDLPDIIQQLERRLAALGTDQSTMQASDAIRIDGRALFGDDIMGALGQRLDAMPLNVTHDRRIPLGTYHGLKFGVVVKAQWRPEVYLEGSTTRQDSISREAGPRAVLNALDRLAATYGPEIARTKRDVEIAQAQLEGYRTRQGQPFQHQEYLDRLSELRDRLRAGLAGEPKEGEPTAADLAERIKMLRAGQVVEAPAERAARKVVGETPVTARILRKEPPPATWQDRETEEGKQAGRG